MTRFPFRKANQLFQILSKLTSMDSELPIINKTYEFYKAIIEVNNQLTKRWRYSLGMHIEDSLLSCLELLVMAKNAPKPLKPTYLIQASGKLEVTGLKVRLLLELQLVNATRVFQLQALHAEIGRMLGGWLKASQST